MVQCSISLTLIKSIVIVLFLIKFIVTVYYRSIPRQCFQQMSTDTDSNYCAFSNNIEWVVKLELREQLHTEYGKWLVTPFCHFHKD